MISRRTLLAGSVVAGSALLSPPRASAQDRDGELQRALASLEQKHGGRLGVAILDTAKKKPLAYRGDERFPMCSTFKYLAAAFVLARVDRKEESLSRRIPYAKDYLVTYSPVTEKHVGEGMTVGDICDAAVTLSDNSAGNLLLDSFGGPAGLTAYMRSLGDKVTRLDRRETELNEAIPGDPRDTTSPLAMLESIDKLSLGNALSDSSREQLNRMDRRQQDRRRALAGQGAERLARRRQDRYRRAQYRERHRRFLANGARARTDHRDGLLHASAGHRPTSATR